MRSKMVSSEALWMNVYQMRVIVFVRDNFKKLDKYKIATLFDHLAEAIREMNIVLQNDKLRTYGNRRIPMDKPVIGQRPSLDDLMKRLERQVNHASILADDCFTGPPANVDETETLAGAVPIMRRLAERVVPNQTPQATSSSTGTSSDSGASSSSGTLSNS